MESLHRYLPSCGRAALLATACLVIPLHAGEPSSLSQREMARRHQGVMEAQELLKRGDESYKAGRYAEAVEAFSGAVEQLPDAPATAELRSAAIERLAVSSVERAREQAKKGDVEGARKTVDKVLTADLAPDHSGAMLFRSELDDPIRTNPGLDAEHAKDIEEVRKGLYTAEGAFNLGKFDQAKAEYQKVLRVDPYNTAARRGLERVAGASSDYQKSAYDHARAEMLAEVEGIWEQQVPKATPPGALMPGGEESVSSVTVGNKLSRIILPKVTFEQTSLEEAIDYLRSQASRYDESEVDPTRKGLNFTLNLGGGDGEAAIRAKRIDLRLTNMPLANVLKYITDATGTSYTTDDYAVIIRSATSMSQEMVTRSYKVPPDFLSSAGSANGKTNAVEDDPFASKPEGGLLPKKRGALEILTSQGIPFPEGASANFNPSSNTLVVRNTAANQELINQVVQSIAREQPIQVVVTVKMFKVEQENIDELSFDSMMSALPVGGHGFIGGGTQGNGGNLGDIPVPTGSTASPITGGNRSGDYALQGNTIDTLIQNSSQGFASALSRSPGIMTVQGLLKEGDFEMMMRGLAQKKGVDLLANPSVVTRSGQAASVLSVREFRYATEYEPPELPNQVGGQNTDDPDATDDTRMFPVTPATPTAFQKRDIGISLEVLPTVGPDKRMVEVELNPEITDFDGFVNFGTPITSIAPSGPAGIFGDSRVLLTSNAILMPIISTKRLKTSVTVADGATLVLGGLMQESVQNVEDKTPLLGSLPVVGRLFESKARQVNTSAILFFVNVRLQDPAGNPINTH